MSDAFDPADIAEIEARFVKAENEAQTTVCMYIEFPAEAAKELVKLVDVWHDTGSIKAMSDLLQFAISIVDSVDDALEAAGIERDDD